MLAEENRKLVQSSIDFPWDDSQVSTVEESALGAMGKWALGMSFLWVELPSPGPEVRGQLGLFIEKAIEDALTLRGAVAPGISSTTGLDVSLSDQLYRARLIEQRGLALGIPSLQAIANRGRTLDAEDSAVLRWWMAASTDRPVRLVLADSNKSLRVYPSPILFESLYQSAPQPVTPRPPSTAMADSAESMELSDLPPAVAARIPEMTREEPGEAKEELPITSLFENAVDLPDLDRALGLCPEPLDETESELPKQKVGPQSLAGEPREVGEDQPAKLKEQLDLTYTPASSVENEALPEANGHDELRVQRVQSPESRSTSEPTRPAIISALTRTEEDSASLPTRSLSQSALERLASLKGKTSSAKSIESEQSEDVALKAKPVSSTSGLDEFGRRPIVSSQPAENLPELQEVHAGEEIPERDSTRGDASQVIQSDASMPGVADAPVLAEPTISDEHDSSVSEKFQPIMPNLVQATEQGEEDEDAFDRLAKAEWRVWARQLEAARGPRPLSVVERHFVTEYTRLREAVRRGIADSSVSRLLDDWGADFSKSYTDAFDALRVRGKRPTMVLDIPEAAARLGRLQGARRVQLVMVDSLRFDLGLMLQDRLRSQVDAALTERLLLWSALPTTTTYQLQLLAKGVDGLKEHGMVDEAPALVARGRAALSPRRIRAGRLELFKVDTVADALAQPGIPMKDRLPQIASSAADVLAEHFKKQPPRTLVVVFGDHGFRLDPSASGTTEEVISGGSSPEEVLVPAFAWLTGAVH